MKWLLLLLLLLPAQAQAKALVADVSDHAIAIDSRFKGTSLLVFGARGDAGDIVVVVRGPANDFIVRKKKRRAGIWVNTQQEEFADVPYYYAMASTQPLDNLPADLLDRLQLGTEHLRFSPEGNYQKPEFIEAFLRQRERTRLYTALPQSITFMGETLFKTVVNFPENIPRGFYPAEVYLIRQGQVISMQSTPISVDKEGLDAFVYDAAHRYPLLYGMFGVMVAFSIGWGANLAFRRI